MLQEIKFYLLLMEGVKVGVWSSHLNCFFSFFYFTTSSEPKLLQWQDYVKKCFGNNYFLACESSLIQKKILCFLNQSLKPLSNKNFCIHHDGPWYCILCSLSVFKKTYSAELWLSTTSNGDPYKLGWEFTVKINLYLLSSPALSVTSLFKALLLPEVILM